MCLLSASARAQHGPVFIIHGSVNTCPAILGLDRALATQDFSYFHGWTFKDFDIAVNWAAVCSNFGVHVGSAGRTDRVRDMETKVLGSIAPPPSPTAPAKNSEEAAVRARAQAAVVAQEAEERKEEAQEQSLARCHRTDAYKLYAAQNRVVADLDRKEKVLEAVEHEKKIEDVSGVQNLTRTYELGAAIVDLDDRIHRDWVDYAMLGGSATAPETVTPDLKNPCKE